MKIGIVIPTYRRESALMDALRSLAPQISGEDVVCVVDAGGEVPVTTLNRYGDDRIRYLRVANDCWWAESVNAGLREVIRCGCTHVLTFNDDNVASPTLLERLRKATEQAPKAIVAAVCNYRAEPNRVFFAGRRRAWLTDRFFYLDHNEEETVLPGGLRYVDLLHGMCTLFPVEVFSEIGQFDSARFPHLFADDDLLLRAARGGYRLVVALDARVYNDRDYTGVNPYQSRPSIRHIVDLLTSRRSAYQVTRRSLFLWQHRTSLVRFLLTWAIDYGRIFSLIALAWLLPPHRFRRMNRTAIRARMESRRFWRM